MADKATSLAVAVWKPRESPVDSVAKKDVST